MSDGPLVGISGKIKILLDRLSSARAAKLDNLTVNLNTLATSTEVAKSSQVSGLLTTAQATLNKTAILEGLGRKAYRFDNSSGNFTIPSGVTVIWVTLQGGGGGGSSGARANNSWAGWGGVGGNSGGCAVSVPIKVTEGQTYVCIRGAGGAGGNRGTSVSSNQNAGMVAGAAGSPSYLYLSSDTNSHILVAEGGNGGPATTSFSTTPVQSAAAHTNTIYGMTNFGVGVLGGLGQHYAISETANSGAGYPTSMPSPTYYGRAGANQGLAVPQIQSAANNEKGRAGGGGGHSMFGYGGTGGARSTNTTSAGNNGGVGQTYSGAGGGGGGSRGGLAANAVLTGVGGAGAKGFVLIEY